MNEGSRQTPDSTPKRRRRKRFVVFLVLLLSIVTVISAEVVVRIYVHLRGWTPNCYAGSVDLFQPQSETGYVLRPGFRLQSGVWKISINEAGFRGPEIAQAKAADAKRVAILGGSSVFGYLVSDGQEATRLLEADLTSAGNLNKVEVINGGVPGHNLNQTRWRFENQIAPFKPDLVILYLGWNDLGYIVSDDPQAEPFHKRPVASALTRTASHSTLYGLIAYRLIGGAASLSAETLTATKPSEPGARLFRENVAALIEAAKAEGCRVVVCAQVTAAHPDADASLHSFLGRDSETQRGMIELGDWQRSALQEEAERSGVPFVDPNEAI
ncbi:MAG: SGNH/GDSL hydrolase family protein, partial [Planctomycetes bacterium]|nr:SGNH/GDSL hydrolase family protein [Planctomycetota bacterium]